MRSLLLPLPLLLFACTPAMYRQEADDQVYGILEAANAKVTGNATVNNIDRPVDTLRARILASGRTGDAVFLTLLDALDVAGENSFEFQTQKERLYLAALSLTQAQNQFAPNSSADGSAFINNIGNTPQLTTAGGIDTSVVTTAGTGIAVGFMNSLLRSIAGGGPWSGSSVLNMTLVQPLLQGSGVAVNREPLTQAERNVIYAVREFEQFRRGQAVTIVSQYYSVVQQMRNLVNVENNLTQVQLNRARAEALFDAGRGELNERDQAIQAEYQSENGLVNSRAGLETSLDAFKRLLGLPTDALIELDIAELGRLQALGVTAMNLDEELVIQLALSRRFDYQTTLDAVDDAARKVILAEDDLRSILDFRTTVVVPTDPNDPLKLDWSNTNWAAGFDLNLALNRLPQRNAYRASLITLDAAIRAREQAEDQIKAEMRLDLRNIQQDFDNYGINANSLVLAQRRVDSTSDLYDAGRVQQRDVNEAQNAFISSQLDELGSLVDYAISRLELMLDLEAIMLEPKGFRFDPSLPMPTGPMVSSPNDPEIANTEEADLERTPELQP